MRVWTTQQYSGNDSGNKENPWMRLTDHFEPCFAHQTTQAMVCFKAEPEGIDGYFVCEAEPVV
jgi:hypothetical protein